MPFGLPSSLARQPTAKPSTKIQKQKPNNKAKGKVSTKEKRKGRAVDDPKTPADGPEDSDQSGDDGDYDEKGQDSKRGRDVARRLMGCPFYKLDPITHYRCVEKHKLVGFNRLKQHIERCHYITEFYCAFCWIKFKNAASRDRHMRLESCQSRPWSEDFMGDELGQLQNDLPRGLSDEDKWFWVWDHFFAGHPRPESPYVVEGIWEPFSLLVRIARSNVTTEEFVNWAQLQYLPPWEDVLAQSLTLRHERAQISRRVPLHSQGDTSIPVDNDAHLTVLGSTLSGLNGNNNIVPFLFPTMNLDPNMPYSSTSTGFLEHGDPQSFNPVNSASQSNNRNPAIMDITDNRAPHGIPPSDTGRQIGMEDIIDFDGGTENSGVEVSTSSSRPFAS
ncbi:hypothetical protein CORC01_11842 [Colletotrichum orchidophilum]|uniref:C2H2-type domain-containing protein n=1 Tax=Colletotrichum orchidophilum TaxID=1209926 RepID=A0A1G4AUR5_9PEZI|nr:uncharacterized protein CORC01_11842 [Colletotrichum orchidophilum]OHE92836.1 hypothetical protein CORC01_11842 [Colletotrichum orchidophilum]